MCLNNHLKGLKRKHEFKPLLYSFKRCCTDVMAPRTDSLKMEKRNI